MKLTVVFLLSATMVVSATTTAQKISFSGTNVPLETFFEAVTRQTGYTVFCNYELLRKAKKITLQLKDVPMEEALQVALKEQTLSYRIVEKTIVVKPGPVATVAVELPELVTVRGRIIRENGEPAIGITVTVKGSALATASDNEGFFLIEQAQEPVILIISGVEIESQEINIGKRTYVEIVVKQRVNLLDETVVIAYGTTSRRLNTGSVTTVSSRDISIQPVANPLAALQGRVAGLQVIQQGGVQGSGFTVQIRGKSSLSQGTEPLFIIDGIPFGDGNTSLNQITNSAASGFSPFNVINPADIESIEVLKDADATAVYGSRGANGVIIITTKKGVKGKMRVTADFKTGSSRVGRVAEMLSMEQYMMVRREAFANDGITPDVNNAPDLFLWDTTQTTDFRKLFTGGTATNTDALLSASGGSDQTQFVISLGYNRQTGLLSEGTSLQRASVHSNLAHTSANKKLSLSLTLDHAFIQTDLLTRDMSYYINLPPHLPLYTADGELNWLAGTTPFAMYALSNPFAEFLSKYKGDFQNTGANLGVSYKLWDGLSLRLNQGVQARTASEKNRQPLASNDPATGTPASATFSSTTMLNWQAEPQLEYKKQWERSRLLVLLGGTWQERVQQGSMVNGYDYTSDLTLSSLSGAGRISAYDVYNQYRYVAGFGRINYTINDTWLFNITARRDGSSRFGPGRRFANFGAAGLGWIFSNAKWMKSQLPFISFAKWRISFGVTGNDQVGDYRFMDTWSNGSVYQGAVGLQPSRLFNPDYSWEKNSKWESALEIGLFQNRLFITSAYFINRSDNQLVNARLPIQTGFNTVQQNFNAVFNNSGWEFTLEKRSRPGALLQWTSAFNISLPRNKLVSFPGIEKTSYASLFIVGKPVTLVRLYRYLGVDPATGVYSFSDEDGNGVINTNDRTVRINTAPSFFGGWQNGFAYKGFRLDLLFEFRKQAGLNYINTQSNYVPGSLPFNHPTFILDRWQKPGDVASIQRFTASSTSPAFSAAYSFLPNSNAVYSDASFIRLKTLSLSYDLPVRYLRELHLQGCSFFLQSQNLLVFTRYTGSDPENQNLYRLPPLKTIVAGARFTF